MAAFFMILFNRKFISFLFALNLFQSAVFAQDNSILVHGSGVESVSQSPMEYATIILAEPGSESPVTGTTTGADGTFKLESSLNILPPIYSRMYTHRTNSRRESRCRPISWI